MSEVLYNSVVWTAGDILTEAKLDNMVANDRAVDAMENGVVLLKRANPTTPASGYVHVFSKDKAGIPTLYTINDVGTVEELRTSKPTFLFPSVGGIVTGSNQFALLPCPYTLEIVRAYAVVKTAPTGANLIVDLLKNGVSIWASSPSNRLTITAGASSGSQTSFDTTSLAQGDTLLPNVIQVGSTVAGVGLSVYLECR